MEGGDTAVKHTLVNRPGSEDQGSDGTELSERVTGGGPALKRALSEREYDQ